MRGFTRSTLVFIGCSRNDFRLASRRQRRSGHLFVVFVNFCGHTVWEIVIHFELAKHPWHVGDYTENELNRYDLYARGATEAQRLGDRKNLQIIAESILELGCLDADH